MSILSAILLITLLITLYRCRVPWFEPVSKLIDKYTLGNVSSESFFPAFRGRELGNIGVNHYFARDDSNIPNVSFPASPGNFGYP